MLNIDRELDRCLTLLRNKIRERGFTQLEVQQALGWGRSYISQLLTKQKSLRIEQILAICSVIGIDTGEFFAELYVGAPGAGQHRRHDVSNLTAVQLEKLKPVLAGLVQLLINKGLITAEEILKAVQEIENEDSELS